MSNMSEGRLKLILAFTFGVVFLAALLIIALFLPSPTDTQFEIFRIIIAIAVGGVAAVIPGFLNLTSQRTQLSLQAGGAVAVFIIVYFYSPARWVVEHPKTINQQTTGKNSPAIVGNGNNVNNAPPSRTP